MGERKRQCVRVCVCERETESRHLEMSGGVFIEENTEVLSKRVSFSR